MNERMSDTVWEPDLGISRQKMDERIRNCVCNFLSWRHTVRLLFEKKVPFDSLKIAEVGCGTGTLSLIFALLGGSVTLIDYNKRVLENAEKIYGLYGCKAELVEADCMNPPLADLTERFDLVISSGLAEHFVGDDRETVIRYHKLLLREGGLACIGVPNKFSPFYQFIRFFRKLTGTWELDIEVPFSPREMLDLAKRVSFREAYVIGNCSLRKDIRDYSIGFGSAVRELLPTGLKNRLKSKKKVNNVDASATYDMRKYCHDMATLIVGSGLDKSGFKLTSMFSAGIYLFAFN